MPKKLAYLSLLIFVVAVLGGLSHIFLLLGARDLVLKNKPTEHVFYHLNYIPGPHFFSSLRQFGKFKGHVLNALVMHLHLLFLF